MIEAIVIIFAILVVAGLIAAGRSLKVVQQFEQGIVFRFGKIQSPPRGAGLTVIRPVGGGDRHASGAGTGHQGSPDQRERGASRTAVGGSSRDHGELAQPGREFGFGPELWPHSALMATGR
jgi:hypothetical protein